MPTKRDKQSRRRRVKKIKIYTAENDKTSSNGQTSVQASNEPILITPQNKKVANTLLNMYDPFSRARSNPDTTYASLYYAIPLDGLGDNSICNENDVFNLLDHNQILKFLDLDDNTEDTRTSWTQRTTTESSKEHIYNR